jgi:hypothetical protein
MTPEEIVSRLDERFRLVSSTGRYFAGRHQALWTTIDWSYSLLDQNERTLFRRLSVFAAGFTLESAEAVVRGDDIEEDDVLDLITALVDRSLLAVDDDGVATRYRMLDTIRHYATQLLDEHGEGQTMHRRHAEHYASFVELVGAGLRSRDELTWSARLQRELDNVRAAVTWAFEAGDAGLGIRLVAGARAHPGTPVFMAATVWAERLLAMPGLDAHPLYPALLTCAAWGALLRGDLEEAGRLADGCMEAEVALPTLPEPLARRVRGLVAASQGNPDESLAWGTEAIAAARANNDDFLLSFSLAAQALALTMAGNRDAAVGPGQESVAIGRRVGSPTAVSYACVACGYAKSVVDPMGSLALLDEAIEQATLVGSLPMKGLAQSIKGRNKLIAGNWAGALGDLRDAADLLHQLGYRPLLSVTLARLAVALAAAGQPETAALCLGASDSRPSPYLADPIDVALLGTLRDELSVTLGPDRAGLLSENGRHLDDAAIVEAMKSATRAVSELEKPSD